ncbi:putative baseplate wedge subunit [Aeromonas phage phiA8-29]|uniref:Putative baseplate wedge subunit n=1 Tax=Aeromonas phage phiA8-29 TaxID=1978922 RepID=A0A1W6DY90_9CAUD|nr:baseplate wedge subunit [Aeromonas phage phiA8-29]ARK07849.1 putative baseplate wedge subunit [Aeromonas phage phiA8-29]
MQLKNYETPVTKTEARYRDIDLNFKRHPSTGDVSVRVDANAVAQALRTIILTNPGDLDEEPDFGVGVWGLLGENMTPAGVLILKEKIIEQSSLYEPRAEISDVVITHDIENYTIRIRVMYFVANIDQMQDVTVSVKRIL